MPHAEILASLCLNDGLKVYSLSVVFESKSASVHNLYNYAFFFSE